MKASIIIPTYNSCERLYLNLLSLSCQDCSRDSYEVVVVDNGSYDGTYEMISDFKAGYKLKYIRIDSTSSRAYARNLGVSDSDGSILIFNDSDMINAADFVSGHIKEHASKNNIICGYGWRRIYSYYYNNFEGYQRNNFVRQKKNYRIKGRDFHNRKSTMLFSEEEILNNEFLKYSFFLDNRQKTVNEIVNEFGYEMKGYCFPWRFFMTSNCSLERSLFTDSGGFDERYGGWGFEDIDLGYRLYKKGYSFKLAPDCISAHQEHPIDRQDTQNDNLYYFLDKYNSIDLYLFYCGKFAVESHIKLNATAKEIEALEASGCHDEVLLDFLNMLKTVRDSCMYVKKQNNSIKVKVPQNLKYGVNAKNFLSAYEELKSITSS